MPECRTCHAEIFWAITRSGKRIPMNKDQVQDGNVRILFRLENDKKQAYVVGPKEGRSYVSHFATCPAAHVHRKDR